MCTVLLPPGDNPIAFNKYIISFIGIINDITRIVIFTYLRSALSKIIMSAAPNVFNISIKLIFSYYTKWIIANYLF